MSAQNSISQLLEQFLELNSNSLETFNRINEAIATDKETVTLDLYDPSSANLRSIQIPSFGYLKREIERLDTNVKSITTVSGNGANVRLKDGTFRQVFTSKLKGPSKPITSLAAPTEFNTKLNEFFEDFLNPLLTIKLDVSGQIPVETERIYIERFIFDNADDATVSLFQERFKGESEINHTAFKSFATDNNLKYHLDSETIEMPIRNMQYSGGLDVLSINSVQKSKIIDGVTQNKTVKLFTLNKLSYTDANKDIKDTEVLKTNDSLLVNSGAYSTRYVVKSIDASTSQVELQLVEGFEPINIGTDELIIYKDVDLDLDVEINVGFNERQVIFIKPIDSISNIPANEYSPGIGFYSNELTLGDSNGNTVLLSEYYKDNVADFGEFIKSLSVDYIPPSNAGIKPIAPDMDPDNLRVVQVNKHLTNNSTIKKIKKLKLDKVAAEQQVKSLDDSIRQKKTLLNTKKLISKIQKDSQKAELYALIAERDSSAKLYSSIISDIKATAESTEINKVTPKYRVRGFWSIPEPRTIGNEILQEVVKFKIRYRYLSASGKTSEIEQIQFKDSTNQSTKTGAFSNWIEADGIVRGRELVDGTYRWTTESEEDAQAINFNSLDLPIQPGETMELMVKSVSEAGYPANPLLSDWSEIISVEFPEGELATDSIIELVNSNDLDSVKISLRNDLEASGVFDHVGDSFTAGDAYYAHQANTIASGFLSDNQSPISVYEKILELQNEIQSLKSQIDGTLGELVVQIIDELGNAKLVKNNSTLKLFAGYYVNELPEANFKGHIVTKNYTIQLSNTKASNLELVSRLIGDVEKAAPTSTANTEFGLGNGIIDPTVSSNTYYTTEGNYDLAPVVYQNILANDSRDYLNASPWQSSQLKGQFIYSRFKNLANDASLYAIQNIDPSKTTGYDDTEYGLSYTFNLVTSSNGIKDYSSATSTPFSANGDTATDFIWAGELDPSGPQTVKLDTVTNTLYDNGLFMHIDHPLLAENNGLTALGMQSNGVVGMPKTAVLRASNPYGNQQTALKLIKTINSNGVQGIRKSVKSSFDPNDQYLLGGHSCGSFLFLSPIGTDSLVVDANNKRGRKIIPGNSNGSISIDLVFQYRMTDYHGHNNSSNIQNTSTGRVGGIIGNTLSNITYSKKIGLDILDANGNDFQFDFEVYAKYKSSGQNTNSITSTSLLNYNTNNVGGPIDFAEAIYLGPNGPS